MVCNELKLDIFVGSKIGTFKHVRYDQNSKKKRKDTSRHLQEIKSIQKGEGITCMAFKDPEETEIILARDNRTIQVYNLLTDEFTSKIDVDFGEGKLQSLSVYNDTIIGAVSSGIVKVWKSKLCEGFELNAGVDLERMRACPYNSNFIATGGKENDLKIWDLEKKETVFEAKNVPHDWLQLRVPIWVSDMCFMPDSDAKQVAICSRYGVVRLYDSRAQRRPVCSVEFPGQSNTCISLGCQDKQVLVGTGRGLLQMVDLRGTGRPDKSYKGSVGAVSCVQCLPQHQAVVSASLDRHLRIHHAQTKQLIHKQYMTSKLSCFLVRSSATPLPYQLAEGETELKEEKEEPEELLEGANVEDEGSDVEYEELFQNMEVIRDEQGEKLKKKKKKEQENVEIEVETSVDISESILKSKSKKKHKMVETVTESDNLVTPIKKKKKKTDELSVEEIEATPSDKKKSKKGKKQKVVEEIAEDSDVEDTEEADPLMLDESIKKLLKSTEKTKRKMDKLKKEKKKRSVFHNC